MIRRTAIIATTATVIAFSNAAFAGNKIELTAHQAHDRYLAAINANDALAVLATVTEDVVFIPPNTPVVIGKAEVEPWVRGYFDKVETSWEKTSLEFVAAGDWAFERYRYKSIELPRDGGAAQVETGNGINIYRLGADNIWRVARDVWVTDGSTADIWKTAELPTCTVVTGPC
ncbi:MAG: nuclear transport factor 2 family protein [Arenibacterium sp.]